MGWFYHNPVSLYAGRGAVDKLRGHLAGFGKVLLLTSPGMVRRGKALWLKEKVGQEANQPEEGGLVRSAIEWIVETIEPNPDVVLLQTMANRLKNEAVGAIVALGGGSVMDSAKVLAVLLGSSEHDIRYYFSHHNEEADALPYFCIPTTAGTGAEMTPFGTVWDREARRKYSFSAKNLYARAAFLEPSTTVSLPAEETLYGAMDAMSHSLETLWNRHASIIGQSLARSAVELICRAYPLVAAQPDDYGARFRLQEASMLAGLAIGQSRSALAHSMSYPLTSHFGVPHGLACSFTLSAIARLVTAKGLWGCVNDENLAMKAAEFMDGLDLASHVKVYCSADKVIALTDEMFAPGRVENFIVPISREDIVRILHESVAS